MDYQNMTVQALRAEANQRNIGTGGQRAVASKAQLIQALTSGTWPASVPASDPAAALSAALLAMMPTPGIDEDRVRQIVREEVPAPPTIRIKVSGADPIEIARQHERFPLLLQTLAVGLNVLLVGPAGTGKTSAARAAAQALGLEFACLSVGPQTSKSDLLGFTDAGGTYRESLFVATYRDGGVFLLDEMDAGNAGVLTVLNAALSGDVMPTPAGMVKRSARFICVAGANTYGQGASRQYVGRNQLDAATLDRFAVLDWPVDEGLEAVMIGLPAPASGLDVGWGGTLDPAGWLARVRAVRASVEREQIRAVVSPRATLAGVALLGAGVGRHWVEEMVLWRGMPSDARTRVEGGAK
jgi:DNA polymerase III delta prime subunit